MFYHHQRGRNSEEDIHHLFDMDIFRMKEEQAYDKSKKLVLLEYNPIKSLLKKKVVVISKEVMVGEKGIIIEE